MTPELKNNNTPYPGMTCSGLEFFVHDGELNVMHNRKVIDFTELPFAVIQQLREAIEQDKNVKMALMDIHPTSEVKRLEQFAKCRFGGLDFKPDILHNQMQEGEYWACPLRGRCEHEGVLCKMPTINGQRLTKPEVSLMRLISSEATNEVIAELLGYKMGTFHLEKKKLYSKLKVQTKQGVAIISQHLNLI